MSHVRSTLHGLVVILPGAAAAVLALAAPSLASSAGAQETPVDAPVVREQYKWSNIWWDCANDPTLPRVLLIGDSISCGYSPVVSALLQGKVHVDRLGTSRSINDPVLLKETAMMLEEYPYVAIHFNNGLHGFHLDGPAYAAGWREYVGLLEHLRGGARLIWASSTPITRPDDVTTLDADNEKVVARNALAAEIMQEHSIPTNDLYQCVIGRPDLRSPDGYHYNSAGYDALGQAVADALRKLIE